jgi:hypothetical protein
LSAAQPNPRLAGLRIDAADEEHRPCDLFDAH